MSIRWTVALPLSVLATATMAFGCASQSPAVPTPEETPTEVVVVIVVTATAQPTLALENTVEATITPLATLTPVRVSTPSSTAAVTQAVPTPTRPRATATARATATLRERTPTATRSATKPSASGGATLVAVANTTTPNPRATRLNALKYPAPVLLRPNRQNNDVRRNGEDIEFTFEAVGPLGGDECYLLHVEFINPKVNPAQGVSDEFLDRARCGDRSTPGKVLKFTVFRPPRGAGVNYGGILSAALAPALTESLRVSWFVQVVQDRGVAADGVHHNVARLSPQAAVFDFDFVP